MDASLSSLLVGIMVMLAVYLSLSRMVDVSSVSVRKSLVLFSAALGLLSSFWLRSHPDMLEEYTGQIVLAGLAVVIALLTYARKSLK